MNFVSILLCLVLASDAEPADMTKLNLSLNNPQNTTTLSIIQKLPEERRQLSIFPKSSRKFIVTPLVYRKYVTQSPITLTKKPLMKKMVFQDKKPNLIQIELTSKRPIMNTKFLSLKPMSLFKKSIQKVNPTENLDLVDEKTEVGFEARNNNFYDGDFSVHGDYSEDIAAVVYPNKENDKEYLTPTKANEKSALKIEDFIFSPKVKPTEAINRSVLSIDDFIFTPNVKPVEVNTETAPTNANMNNLSQIPDSVSPEEVADRSEFIFINEKNTENYIPNATDELIPITEIILASKPRLKRSINVIEEENLAPTASAGLMFTDRDTELINDLVYKNIHS